MKIHALIKPRSMFYKLIISYMVLVILITVIIGSTTFVYSSKNYNQEVIKLNQDLLSQFQALIEKDVINKVTHLHSNLMNSNNDISSFFYLTDVDISRVRTIYDNLHPVVRLNSEYIDSIDIYDKNKNILISSKTGLNYFEDSPRWDRHNHYWIYYMDQYAVSRFWFSSMPNNSTSKRKFLLTYATAYPRSSNDSNCMGYIAFHVKEEYLQNIIKDSSINQDGQLFIIDHNGNIITHNDPSLTSLNMSETSYIKTITSEVSNYQDFIAEVDGIQSMVSFTSFATTGWKLVRTTPVNSFYSASFIIQRNIIIICLLAILIGLIMAYLFANHIYNPLRLVVDLLKKVINNSTTDKSVAANEYVFINDSINRLSHQITKLSKQIIENRPLIKYNFINSILNNTIHTDSELRQRLDLLELSMHRPYFNVILIHINKDYMNNLELKNIELFKYDLITQIESKEEKNHLFIASEITDAKIAIIINSTTKFMTDIVKYLMSYSSVNFMIDLDISIGNWYDSVFDIHLSYQEASSVINYKYFLPNRNIFDVGNFASIKDVSDQTFIHILSQFEHAITTENLNEAKRVLALFMNEVISGDYSYEYCNRMLMEITTIFSRFTRNLNFNVKYVMSDFHEKFMNATNINEFINWLSEAITSTLDYNKYKVENKIEDIIHTTKAYIHDNISMDLSLSNLSEMVNLSSSYFCRIFKEGTGINLIDYITQKRMETAKELLENSMLNIEEIASKVGFNTPHYFSKKFKEFYDITPKAYKYGIIKETDKNKSSL